MPLAALCLVLAAVVEGYLLQWTHGHYNPDAIKWVVGCWALVIAALVLKPSVPFRVLGVDPLTAILAIGLGAQVYLMSVVLPTIEMTGLRQASDLHDFFMGLAIVGVLAGAGLSSESPLKKIWFPLAIAVHFFMGRLVLHHAPNPQIDVFTVEVDSLKALLSGTNPYSITFPNPYGDGSPFFPPHVQQNGRLMFGFVYPPLALLLLVPGWVFAQDPRYSLLLAMEGAALLIGYARPGNLPKLFALVFLFTPRTFFVLDRAWTDPFVVLLTAAVAFCALRYPKWLFVPAGLFLCLKQHMFIGAPALLLLLPRPWKPKALFEFAWKTAAVGAAVTLPFFLWGPGDFIKSVIDIREVYRLDCLSLLAHLANTGVARLSKWSGIVAMLPIIALGVWKAPRNAAGFATLVAATHFTLYLFSTHAFCNEHYNVIGSICLAGALWAPAPEEAKAAAPAQQPAPTASPGAASPAPT